MRLPHRKTHSADELVSWYRVSTRDTSSRPRGTERIPRGFFIARFLPFPHLGSTGVSLFFSKVQESEVCNVQGVSRRR